MTIGDRIKLARQRSGLTQSQLAERLGIDRSQRQRVSIWETGKATPRKDTLEAIASITGTTAAWLDYGIGIPPKERATE